MGVLSQFDRLTVGTILTDVEGTTSWYTAYLMRTIANSSFVDFTRFGLAYPDVAGCVYDHILRNGSKGIVEGNFSDMMTFLYAKADIGNRFLLENHFEFGINGEYIGSK